MNSLLKSGGDNLGSLKNIRFIAEADVDVIPVALNSEITTAVTLAAGKSWLDAEVSQESGGYSETPELTPAGERCTVTIKAFFPGPQSAAIADNLKKMFRTKHIVQAEDHEGQIRLAGTKDYPLRFRYSFGTLDKVAGLKGWTLEWFGTLEEAAPHYNV